MWHLTFTDKYVGKQTLTFHTVEQFMLYIDEYNIKSYSIQFIKN